jgi:hypothetical protein
MDSIPQFYLDKVKKESQTKKLQREKKNEVKQVEEKAEIVDNHPKLFDLKRNLSAIESNCKLDFLISQFQQVFKLVIFFSI